MPSPYSPTQVPASEWGTVNTGSSLKKSLCFVMAKFEVTNSTTWGPDTKQQAITVMVDSECKVNSNILDFPFWLSIPFRRQTIILFSLNPSGSPCDSVSDMTVRGTLFHQHEAQQAICYLWCKPLHTLIMRFPEQLLRLLPRDWRICEAEKRVYFSTTTIIIFFPNRRQSYCRPISTWSYSLIPPPAS